MYNVSIIHKLWDIIQIKYKIQVLYNLLHKYVLIGKLILIVLLLYWRLYV